MRVTTSAFCLRQIRRLNVRERRWRMGMQSRGQSSSLSLESSLSPLSSDDWIVIPSEEWRAEADQHQRRIFELLRPGMLAPDPKSKKKQHNSEENRRELEWRGLDPRHPIYNFLIEYYGIRGTKGVRRLARWSPDPAPLIRHQNRNAETCGILLEKATMEDVAQTLHLRGSIPVMLRSDDDDEDEVWEGLVYSPSFFFGSDAVSAHRHVEQRQKKETAAPYLWYRSVLQTTLRSEPVLHCHGLHEWAMQYQPPHDEELPPSAKYQAHLPLRVSRQTIREAVERNGVSCTHVDALRFFAPSSKKFNSFGASLQRSDQLRLEQPACVHVQMDLIKMALRLTPFVSSDLVARALEVALQARRLDIEASPYDASSYGLGVVAVETEAGRREYRKRQVELMQRAAPIRRELLQAYDNLLWLGFGIG